MTIYSLTASTNFWVKAKSLEKAKECLQRKFKNGEEKIIEGAHIIENKEDKIIDSKTTQLQFK